MNPSRSEMLRKMARSQLDDRDMDPTPENIKIKKLRRKLNKRGRN